MFGGGRYTDVPSLQEFSRQRVALMWRQKMENDRKRRHEMLMLFVVSLFITLALSVLDFSAVALLEEAVQRAFELSSGVAAFALFCFKMMVVFVALFAFSQTMFLKRILRII